MVLLVTKSAEFLVNAVEHIETMVIHINGHYRAEMLSYFRSTAKNLGLARNHGAKAFDITSFGFCFWLLYSAMSSLSQGKSVTELNNLTLSRNNSLPWMGWNMSLATGQRTENVTQSREQTLQNFFSFVLLVGYHICQSPCIKNCWVIHGKKHNSMLFWPVQNNETIGNPAINLILWFMP